MNAFFIAGTDTEIGKTFVTCALLHAARRQGLRALGMKPIAAGAEWVNGEFLNEDAARIRAAGSFDPGLALLNPYCLASPIAPHIAAAEEGVSFDTQKIFSAFDALRAQADWLLVEGVGSALFGLALTTVVVGTGTALGLDPRLAKLAAIAASFTATWLLRERVIFRPRMAA